MLNTPLMFWRRAIQYWAVDVRQHVDVPLDRDVFAAAGVAGPPTGVAGREGGVEAEAGHQHGQQGQPNR